MTYNTRKCLIKSVVALSWISKSLFVKQRNLYPNVNGTNQCQNFHTLTENPIVEHLKRVFIASSCCL